MPLIPFTGQKLREDDVAAFEQRLGAKLPVDYREFLLETNGGKPKPELVFEFRDITGKVNHSCPRHFFCLLPDSHFHSIMAMLSLYQNRILTNYIPIAEDAFDNLILLSTLPDDYGHIYFWDFEEEDEDEPTRDNMSLIAPSFADFMASLSEEIQSPLMQRNLGAKKGQVNINLSGDWRSDEMAANKAAGHLSTPDGFSWHHHQDVGVMQLAQQKVHKQFPHRGGMAIWRRMAAASNPH